MSKAPTDKEAAILEPQSETGPSPEEISADILVAAREVIETFDWARPDGYAARLESSNGESMTITDETFSNGLERALPKSAVLAGADDLISRCADQRLYRRQ